MDLIAYKKDYKYQIVKDYVITVPIKPEYDIDSDFLSLDVSGRLFIRKGYAWDGPSGPTIHTPRFMRASLVHDALYQLMRHDHIDRNRYRRPADVIFREICKEDGMSMPMRWWVYLVVRVFASFAADPAARKRVITAPIEPVG